MATPWWAIIPSPLDTGTYTGPGATPNIEHEAILTRKGRVVYNRKPHQFTNSDLLRVAAGIYDINPTSSTGILLILERITIWMLDKILDKITAKDLDEGISSLLYYYIRNSLAKIIDRLPTDMRASADEFLATTYGL